jgi:hypothetical protein
MTFKRTIKVKILLSIIVILGLAASSMGQSAPDTTDKTKRMIQLEKKFEMVIKNIIVDKTEKFWLFQAVFPEGLFGFVPVMVKPDATDKEVASAVMSSKTCANLYDITIKAAAKKAQQRSEQSPMVYQ